ncbi:MAG: phosphate ABC transporter substrate-binding protein PstS family protein [Candidatus Dadabacteria bacterium]|nr:phosphate ABC transporter substrate-binding protein PstS family protein [Candidatus Dadabacteria bacterium]
MFGRKLRLFLIGLAALAVAAPVSAVEVDGKLPNYRKTKKKVSGTINSIGSDTMNNLMALWCEGFKKRYPRVKCQIEGKGSSTAPPALIKGTSQFGPMSRKMKAKEVDAFEKQFGYKPVAIPTAVDMLAVFVNEQNPVKCLSIRQVDAAFSKTRRCGADSQVSTWGDLGVTGAWASGAITLYGRNSASGTYGYFKKRALCKGDFSDSVKEQPGSASVVQGITKDKFAMGYSGIGYKTSGVRAIALSKRNGKCIEPEPHNTKYPLARHLYLYVNKEPRSRLDTLRKEFLKFVLSKQGQKVAIKDGYIPLDNKTVRKIRKEYLDDRKWRWRK